MNGQFYESWICSQKRRFGMSSSWRTEWKKEQKSIPAHRGRGRGVVGVGRGGMYDGPHGGGES